MNEDKCCMSGCKGKPGLTYYGKPVCDKHWEKLSEKTPDELKDLLGVRRKKVGGKDGSSEDPLCVTL